MEDSRESIGHDPVNFSNSSKHRFEVEDKKSEIDGVLFAAQICKKGGNFALHDPIPQTCKPAPDLNFCNPALFNFNPTPGLKIPGTTTLMLYARALTKTSISEIY